MEEHIKLLQKEIEQLKRNIVRAEARTGVEPRELEALRKKLSIKIDILQLVLLQVVKEWQREGK